MLRRGLKGLSPSSLCSPSHRQHKAAASSGSRRPSSYDSVEPPLDQIGEVRNGCPCLSRVTAYQVDGRLWRPSLHRLGPRLPALPEPLPSTSKFLDQFLG